MQLANLFFFLFVFSTIGIAQVVDGYQDKDLVICLLVLIADTAAIYGYFDVRKKNRDAEKYLQKRLDKIRKDRQP